MILPTNCLKFLISHNFGPSMNLNPTKYLFVINPGSGNQQMRNWNELITNNLNGSDFEILISKDPGHSKSVIAQYQDCLLYTSDAADERSSVDLGGRRIIKKKK